MTEAINTLMQSENGSREKLSIVLGSTVTTGAMLMGAYAMHSIDTDIPRSSCIIPSDKAYQAVDDLIEEPRVSDPLQKQALAKQLGLTIFDAPNKKRMAFADVKEFVGNYGVDLVAPPSLKTEQYNYLLDVWNEPIEPIQAAQLDKATTRKQLANVAKSFEALPKEIIDYPGLEEVILTDMDGEFGGFVPPNSEVYVADLYAINNSYLANHELFHLVDTKLCGIDAGNDRAFQALNPVDFAYNPDKQDKMATLENAEEVLKDAWWLRDRKVKKWEQEYQQKAEKKMQQAVVTRLYGQKSVIEDKATFAERLLASGKGGLNSLLRNGVSETIRSKAILLLGRLYMELPKVTEYLIRTR